ncbi:MAG: hypothetical protein O7G85_11420 [Planctomycetota bacterium]|nr:hypothetical protein [Planctomycetota bacterium]
MGDIVKEQTLNSNRRVVEVQIGSSQETIHEVDSSTPPMLTKKEIGKGRSAVVYRVSDGVQPPWAQKLFLGDPLAKLVHLVFSGAPNPYTWNEDAIETAVLRRRILAMLVQFWFGDRMRLPDLIGSQWNDQARAYQIDMEFVTGRAAALRHHVAYEGGSEIGILVKEIMNPLQKHLRDSGFDGLVWQAGYGNPVASSNFLLDDRDADEKSLRWVWIDLESGVPALFPLNPLTLFGFYIPKSIRHRCALFDDVDTNVLHAYLQSRQEELESLFGSEKVGQLFENVERLGTHQQAWKRLGRFKSSLQYAHKRGHLTDHEADYYRNKPIRWNARIARRGLQRAPYAMVSLVKKVWRKVMPIPPITLVRMTGRFLFFQKWRARWASHMLRRRIKSWERRKQLASIESRHLVTHVRSDEATEYLTDFGMHLVIKFPVKAIEYGLFPMLAIAGLVSNTTVLVVAATGGIIGRSTYTLWRIIQATARGRERPWIALITGFLPIVGNAAYPIQILYTSSERNHDVAKFILIDIFTTLGRKIPIWGGPDTLTEHFFNRLPLMFLARLSPANPKLASQTSEEAIHEES